MNPFSINKLLWKSVLTLTCITALIGIFVPHLYDRIIPKEFVSAALPQDILTVILCVTIFMIAHEVQPKDVKQQSIILGTIGSMSYLYGIFTIEKTYNLSYYLYLLIFGLSCWTILYSLATLDKQRIQSLTISNRVRKTSAIFSLIIAILFIALWASALYPLLIARSRIEYLYSIYILDLCFVMPAFIITAILSLKKNPLGYFLAPAMFILGIFVIFPLGLGELAKPFHGMQMNTGSMAMSFILSGAFLVMTIIHLNALKTSKA